VNWTARDKESNIETKFITLCGKPRVILGIITSRNLIKMAKAALSRLKAISDLLTAGTEDIHD
jgi:hypothetical protein